MKAPLAAAMACIALSAASARAQTAYPFVGRWNCEVANFIFTDKTYNNGTETLRMTKVTKKGGDYELTFPKNYTILVGSFKGNTMSWLSGASGDGFTCKRIK